MDYKTLRFIICLMIVFLVSNWTPDITILVFPIFPKGKKRKEKSYLAFERKQAAKKKDF